MHTHTSVLSCGCQGAMRDSCSLKNKELRVTPAQAVSTLMGLHLMVGQGWVLVTVSIESPQRGKQWTRSRVQPGSPINNRRRQGQSQDWQHSYNIRLKGPTQKQVTYNIRPYPEGWNRHRGRDCYSCGIFGAGADDSRLSRNGDSGPVGRGYASPGWMLEDRASLLRSVEVVPRTQCPNCLCTTSHQTRCSLVVWDDHALVARTRPAFMELIFKFNVIWKKSRSCILSLFHIVNLSRVSGDNLEICFKIHSWSKLKC